MAWRDGAFALRVTPLRERDAGERPFFERNWPDYLTGAIYEASD